MGLEDIVLCKITEGKRQIQYDITIVTQRHKTRE